MFNCRETWRECCFNRLGLRKGGHDGPSYNKAQGGLNIKGVEGFQLSKIGEDATIARHSGDEIPTTVVNKLLTEA